MTAPPAFNPVPGKVDRLRPGLRRVLAPNPSPMTFRGTNSYILGEGRVAVIDPGPALSPHLAALLAGLGRGETVSHILVTHSHLDHSALAPALAEATGAPVLAFGDSRAGRREETGLAEPGGGEGVDSVFRPDICLADGEMVEGDGWRLAALHTPGHMGNHMCFAWEDALFTGDHVMGWASSLISPPDGDIGDYMRALDKLAARTEVRFFPGHGAPIADGPARLAELATHRRTRARQIAEALADGPATPRDLAARIYTGTPADLLPAAARNVLAHLIDLQRNAEARPVQRSGTETVWERA